MELRLILWQGHHDRVFQLNWLYFCGICQMMTLKVVANIALRLQPVQSILQCPRLQPLCVSCSTPEGWRLGQALCSHRSLIVYLVPPLRIRTQFAVFEFIPPSATTSIHCRHRLVRRALKQLSYQDRLEMSVFQGCQHSRAVSLWLQ